MNKLEKHKIHKQELNSKIINIRKLLRQYKSRPRDSFNKVVQDYLESELFEAKQERYKYNQDNQLLNFELNRLIKEKNMQADFSLLSGLQLQIIINYLEFTKDQEEQALTKLSGVEKISTETNLKILTHFIESLYKLQKSNNELRQLDKKSVDDTINTTEYKTCNECHKKMPEVELNKVYTFLNGTIYVCEPCMLEAAKRGLSDSNINEDLQEWIIGKLDRK